MCVRLRVCVRACVRGCVRACMFLKFKQFFAPVDMRPTQVCAVLIIHLRKILTGVMQAVCGHRTTTRTYHVLNRCGAVRRVDSAVSHAIVLDTTSTGYIQHASQQPQTYVREDNGDKKKRVRKERKENEQKGWMHDTAVGHHDYCACTAVPRSS